MADAWTGQWGNNYSPQIHLAAWVSSENQTTATISWYLDYVAHGYAAYTNGVGRSWNVTIAGAQRGSGSYNINGQTGTVRLGSGSFNISKTHAWQSVGASASFYFDVSWNGSYSGWRDCSTSFGVNAKTSYTISFNANGGSGAPGNQTKWHGENLTLSGTKPTRTGYTFAGWATSASGTVAYQAGSTYTGNANATLYAKWTAITYTVKYNANGGTGAPGNQTKTYGVTLKLSSTKPTRTNYNFRGWGTSAGATSVAYAAGANYTANAAITLYAIWEIAYTPPKITNLSTARCNSAGTTTDEGRYIRVKFNWSVDSVYSSGVSSIVINHRQSGQTGNGTNTTVSDQSGKSGSVDQIIGANAIDTELQYTVRITVTDNKGSSWVEDTVAPTAYIIDFKAGGDGVTFGAPASETGVVMEWPTRFRNYIQGFQSVGNLGDAWKYKLLARTNVAQNGVQPGGCIRVYGSLGGYSGSAHGVIDVKIPIRNGSASTIEINAFGPGLFGNAYCRLCVIVDSSQFVNVYVAVKSYHVFNLFLEFSGYPTHLDIIDSDWSTTTPSGTWWFNSGDIKTDQFGGYPLKTEKLNGYYGIALPDKTRSDWFRTTYNGLIPYQSGGASALGTDTWPFANIFTKNLEVQNGSITWDSAGLRGRVMKLLWSGTWSSGTITVSELPYYNFWIFESTSSSMGTQRLFVYRELQSSTANLIGFKISYEPANWAVHTFSLGAYINTSSPTVLRVQSGWGGLIQNRWTNRDGWAVWLSVTKIYGIL